MGRIKGFLTFMSDQLMTSNPLKPMLPAFVKTRRVSDAAFHAAAAHYFRYCALGCVGLALAGCSATQTNHPLRGAATTVGFATLAGEPKDFVKASRGKTELAFVPIGRGGIERPVPARNAAQAKDLETELDRTRDQSDNFARRQLPPGAFGQAFPSVAVPPKPVRASAGSGANEQPTPGAPESFPVSPNRLRQIRENSRQATE
jgi:hypothetical protein